MLSCSSSTSCTCYTCNTGWNNWSTSTDSQFSKKENQKLCNIQTDKHTHELRLTLQQGHSHITGEQWRTHTFELTAETKQAAFHTSGCDHRTGFWQALAISTSLLQAGILQSVNFCSRRVKLVLSPGPLCGVSPCCTDVTVCGRCTLFCRCDLTVYQTTYDVSDKTIFLL